MDESTATERLPLPTSDESALEQIAHKREDYEQRNSYLNRLHRAGDTELESLLHLAVRGSMCAWGGLIAVGGIVGLPFFIVGALVGAVLVAWVAIVPILLAASLFLTLRGRVSIAAMMGWAGSLTGALCGSISQMISGPHNTWRDLSIDAPLLIPSALVGAGIAWWRCDRGVTRFHLVEGLGTRPVSRFGVVDLMLVTLWLSLMLTAIRFWDAELVQEWTPPIDPLRVALSIPLAWCGVQIARYVKFKWWSNEG